MNKITNFRILRIEIEDSVYEYKLETFIDWSPVPCSFRITKEEYDRFVRLMEKPVVKRKRHKKPNLAGLFNFQEI